MSGSTYEPDNQESLESLFGTVFDLADQVASRVGPEEIEVRLQRTLQDAASGSKPRGRGRDQAAKPGRAVPAASLLPGYWRTIIALDIEHSAGRPNPVKGELRNKAYELFEVALSTADIGKRYRDPFIDRGDGILALIHPVDQAPKALLLNHVVPLLGRLLAEYNASLPRHSQPQRQLRIRVVVHAGEVHYDTNGCYGEALDVAFRLLDAARVKKILRESADPLVLVISEEIHSSVVRHGYDSTDQSFHPLVRVRVDGRSYPGWVHISGPVTPHRVTRIDSYRRLA